MPGGQLCQEGHASTCTLATWEDEQAASCDALVPGTGSASDSHTLRLCTCCNLYRQQLIPSGLLHAQGNACVQSVPDRPRIYVPLASCIGCTTRCNAARELLQCITYAAKCNIKRFALSGQVQPHSDACVRTVLPR